MGLCCVVFLPILVDWSSFKNATCHVGHKSNQVVIGLPCPFVREWFHLPWSKELKLQTKVGLEMQLTASR